MTDSTDSARDFVRSLAALAETLADCDIVVRRLHCDWSVFGSWIVEASGGAAQEKVSEAIRRQAYDEPGPEVFCVTWDARDRRLLLESTPTGAISMSNQWRELEARQLDSHDAALVLAEEWLKTRLGARSDRAGEI